jgi:transcriptional regulator with XRE-family HTH domain
MKINIQSVSDIGRIVRASRKAQNVRLDDVAGSAQLSTVFVGDTERGKDSIQLGKVLRLMNELGIRMTVEIPDSTQPYLDKVKAQGIRPARKRPAGKRTSVQEKSE